MNLSIAFSELSLSCSLCACVHAMVGNVKNACTCRRDLGPKELISEYIGLFPF